MKKQTAYLWMVIAFILMLFFGCETYSEMQEVHTAGIKIADSSEVNYWHELVVKEYIGDTLLIIKTYTFHLEDGLCKKSIQLKKDTIRIKK